jgi:hydroxymethylglutaryl-CoA reductase (NADPH)
VLCGELSLGSAIVAEEWVRAHDLLGRNERAVHVIGV